MFFNNIQFSVLVCMNFYATITSQNVARKTFGVILMTLEIF